MEASVVDDRNNEIEDNHNVNNNVSNNNDSSINYGSNDFIENGTINHEKIFVDLNNRSDE